MRRWRFGLLAGALLAALCPGCESTERHFRITSFPQGATVYVDGEQRGETNFERLKIDFAPEDKLVTLRLEKEGYQSTGCVLAIDSRREAAFFLEEAPSKLRDSIEKIREVLEQIRENLKEENP